MSFSRRLTVALSVAVGMLVPGVASALAAVSPGWECIPTTAGKSVVSGGMEGDPIMFWQSRERPVRSGARGEQSRLGKRSVFAGQANTASGAGASVTGGQYNLASDKWSSIAGGCDNLAGAGAPPTGPCSTSAESILGGASNQATGTESTVSAGQHNSATGAISTVSAGYSNSSDGLGSSISGG